MRKKYKNLKISDGEIMAHILTIEEILRQVYNIDTDKLNESLQSNRMYIKKEMGVG